LITFIFLQYLLKKNKTILINGVKAYLNGDYLTAAHLFIPQIESGLRDILQLSGGSVYKPGRNGGMFLKTLDDILREETIIKTFGDGAKYLQVLLTDQRGWNIRNNLCHGMIPYDMFGPVITNRLFHVLLVLALVREETN
jgi:hypothetical protein